MAKLPERAATDPSVPKEYAPIERLVEESLTEVLEGYGDDVGIGGTVEFDVQSSDGLVHIAEYSVGDLMGHSGFYDYIHVYYQSDIHTYDIRIIVNVIDPNSVGNGYISRAFARSIAKAINARVKEQGNHDKVMLSTLTDMIKDEQHAFTLGAMYRAADEVGITDYRLVDMAVQNLIIDKALVCEGNSSYRIAKSLANVG